jgi:acetamidase/formamidase
MARVELGFEVRRDLPVTGPVVRSADGAWLTLGLGDTLDDAAFEALAAMLTLLQRRLGVSRPAAVALASVAVDLTVTQLVNQVVGVHATLPPNAIANGR